MAGKSVKTRNQGERPSASAGGLSLRTGIGDEAASSYDQKIVAELAEARAELTEARAELVKQRDLDRCVSVRVGAELVGVSHDYLYTHREKLPFVLPMGSRWVVDPRKLRECKDEGGIRFEKPTPPPITLGTANRRRRSSRSWH
jgi:hypothetical protein